MLLPDFYRKFIHALFAGFNLAWCSKSYGSFYVSHEYGYSDVSLSFLSMSVFSSQISFN